jgi:hypothetical protein
METLEPDPTPEDINNVMEMDYSFYRAVVMTVYGYTTLEEIDTKVPNEDPKTLKDFLIKFKNRPPFKLEDKQKRVEEYYQTVDLMFLQEAGSVEWPQI